MDRSDASAVIGGLMDADEICSSPNPLLLREQFGSGCPCRKFGYMLGL
jgi:hypothetical protein